jgi:hypothetical protein
VIYETFQKNDGTYDEPISLHEIKILVPPLNGSRSPKPSFLNLSRMTEEELDLLKELFNKAFEMARPTVQARDRNAVNDIDDPRNYRQIPRFIERERPKPPYLEGVSGGSEGDDGMVGESEDDFRLDEIISDGGMEADFEE